MSELDRRISHRIDEINAVLRDYRDYIRCDDGHGPIHRNETQLRGELRGLEWIHRLIEGETSAV